MLVAPVSFKLLLLSWLSLRHFPTTPLISAEAVGTKTTGMYTTHGCQRYRRQPQLLPSYIRNPTTLRSHSHLLPYRQHRKQPPQQSPNNVKLVVSSLSAWMGPASPFVASKQPLTPLPTGLSPFDKSKSKTYDVQGSFRTIAYTAIQKAIASNNKSGKGNAKLIYEIEFPPLVRNGIDVSKNQFDDFDNVQELNANRDWCIQLIPKLLQSSALIKTDVVWFILPDDKECEIAKTEYVEQLRYQSTNTILFTSIRAAFIATTSTTTSAAVNGGGGGGGTVAFKKAWGTSIAETINKLQGGDGILADSSTLDILQTDDDVVSNDNNSNKPPRRRIQMICQPGNGGPVEDWINVEQFFYNTNNDAVTTTIVVNGALDKVRDGYYPAIFFPALAKTIPFYKSSCEPILFVKPISDKGLYGWIFRVYPEPWQIILQLPRRQQQQQQQQSSDDDTAIVVDDIVVLVSDKRPTYQEAVNVMVQEAQRRQPQQQQL